MTHISPLLLYWIAIVVFFAWYNQRRRVAAARRKELLGNGNPDDYSPASQPRDTTPLAVFGIMMAATLAFIAWQQHHR